MTLANSIDPDETAPMGAVSSRSTLFAYTKMKVLTNFGINTTELKCNASGGVYSGEYGIPCTISVTFFFCTGFVLIWHV